MEVGILTFCNSSNCKAWHLLNSKVFSVCKHASIQAATLGFRNEQQYWDACLPWTQVKAAGSIQNVWQCANFSLLHMPTSGLSLLQLQKQQSHQESAPWA